MADEPGWTGVRRSDGAFISAKNAVVFAVHAPPGKLFPAYGGRMNEPHPVLTRCSCCERQFFSMQAAQLAANALLPVETGDG